MHAAEGNPLTIQAGASILGRAASLDDAIAWTLDKFDMQQAACRILGHSPARWAASTSPRIVRHAGRTVARITPRPDGSAGVERVDDPPRPRRSSACRPVRPPGPSLASAAL